jgi:acetyltransferase-like isoleucine patch superfamily enzyme
MKSILKSTLTIAAILLVSPLAISERLLHKALGRDVLFSGCAQLLSLFPGKCGSYIRNAYYHFTLRSCPLDCRFEFGMLFTQSDARVGSRVYIGSFARVGKASIGDYTMIADHVNILSGRHQHATEDTSVPYQCQSQTFEEVQIARNVWIGANSVVMANLDENCIVGAGAVVTHPVAAGCVVAGVPARVIRGSTGESIHKPFS